MQQNCNSKARMSRGGGLGANLRAISGPANKCTIIIGACRPAVCWSGLLAGRGRPRVSTNLMRVFFCCFSHRVDRPRAVSGLGSPQPTTMLPALCRDPTRRWSERRSGSCRATSWNILLGRRIGQDRGTSGNRRVSVWMEVGARIRGSHSRVWGTFQSMSLYIIKSGPN